MAMTLPDSQRALPEGLHIGWSDIDGQGVFTDRQIPNGERIGRTHTVDLPTSETTRSPLGAFLNEAPNPNCYKHRSVSHGVERYYLTAARDIDAGEELTLRYTLVNSVVSHTCAKKNLDM